jgi:hypothetical protein
MIYLEDGHMTLTDPQGREQDMRFKAGDVRWSPAGGQHISDNTGATTYRIVEVELKNKPGALPATPLDPARVAPEHYTVELENPQVRVMRVRYGPREAGVTHEHILNRVMVLLTDQNTKVTAADGKVEMARGAASDVRMGGAAKHQEENLNVRPLEVVVVELKR